MKKSTLENLCNYLNGDDTVDLSILREEVTAEYDRVTAKSRENAKAYENAREILLACEDWTTPMTAKEIAEKYHDILPDGFSPSKIQYGFRVPWVDDFEKHENGKNPYTYTRK